MVESLPAVLFIGAGAGVGAGEKNTQSRSQPKTDRLHNTGMELVKMSRKRFLPYFVEYR